MDETIAVDSVNEALPAILRHVRGGETFVLVANGEPVARLVPTTLVGGGSEEEKAAFLAELAARPPRILAERWTRDELHED